MKKSVFVLAALFAAVTLFTINAADAQWRNPTHDVYNAPTGVDITIDGNLDEWGEVMDAVTGTDGSPFCGVEFEGREGEVKVWENAGGTWSGTEDHETCFMIAWNPDAAYIALSVTDDEHQNGGAAWNGDSLQIAFEPTGKRTSGLALFLYNVALDGNTENLILHNERTNGLPGLVSGEDFVITRDEAAKKTYYELRFTPANFGVDTFSEGTEVGLGICVNDGDVDTPGQTGWGGWYPHAVIDGKNSEKTGLVVLTSTAVTAVEPADKLATTWGNLKSEK